MAKSPAGPWAFLIASSRASTNAARLFSPVRVSVRAIFSRWRSASSRAMTAPVTSASVLIVSTSTDVQSRSAAALPIPNVPQNVSPTKMGARRSEPRSQTRHQTLSRADARPHLRRHRIASAEGGSPRHHRVGAQPVLDRAGVPPRPQAGRSPSVADNIGWCAAWTRFDREDPIHDHTLADDAEAFNCAPFRGRGLSRSPWRRSSPPARDGPGMPVRLAPASSR